MNELEKAMAEEAAKTPEQREEDEQLKAWLAMHPEIEHPAEVKESRIGIAAFEEMVSMFEAQHPVEELMAIAELTPEQAPHHRTREAARLDLEPIVQHLNFLKKETDISEEKYEELRQKYKRLSRAVGIINKGKVDHTR